MTLPPDRGHITTEQRQSVRDNLDALAGVTPFAVEDDLRMGILVEARDADSAHAILEQNIRTIPGVLGTWPVYMGEDHD